MIDITKEEIDVVSGLAQLVLSDQEKEMFRSNMQDVLGYFDTLSQVDTADVPEIGHITGMEDVYRSDDAKETATELREALMANVSQEEDGYIVVKNVL